MRIVSQLFFLSHVGFPCNVTEGELYMVLSDWEVGDISGKLLAE